MIDRLSMDRWRAFDAAHPAPTFFARPAWALALAQAYPNMRPAPLRVRPNGESAVTVPLMQLHGGPLRWREYCGFPLGGYTCFLQDDGTLAAHEHMNRAIGEIARFADAATIVPWPLGPAPAAGRGYTQHETALVDLRDGIEKALAGVDGAFRRMAGQAARRGVVCAPSRGADAVDVYYELLEASARRWGLERPGIPKSLIAALVEHGGDDVEIWFARAEGRAIAGGVVLYGSKEFFFWSAAMLAEYGRLRPSNALNFALLHAAAQRGMSWYNLGSSEGLPGVARFKRDLGAQEATYCELSLARTPYKLYRNVRRVLASRASA
ncbi:MAG TPA: GNAT family N-acetyltransferase [Candidatus Baltobacteraceae bacterium]|nr:GNAT family N-acetyltransferase [Candidatus Baltobacteraceae bacterium]